MSNDSRLNNLLAEHLEEQRRKQRGLMADQFNLDCSSMQWPKLNVDPITGRPTYPPKQDNGERNRRTDRPAPSELFKDEVSANVNKRLHSHYFKDVSKYKEADVYRACQMFDINDPSGATQHAIKKLLLAGGRGSKDRLKDLQEAIDTMRRLVEMMKEDAA